MFRSDKLQPKSSTSMVHSWSFHILSSLWIFTGIAIKLSTSPSFYPLFIYNFFFIPQELIFTLDGIQPFGWYLTLIQFGYYTIFGWVECRIRGVTRKIPLGTYLLLAFLTLGTMGFSNSSLGYLNYPTQVNYCKI